MSSDIGAGKPPLDPQTVRLIHDMRNGLATMRAAANMLERSGTDARVVAKVIAGLHQQVHEMVALLDEFVGRAAVEPRIPSIDKSTDTPKPAGPLNVLIADDNADSANALAMYLRMEGHRVAVAFDGEQALQLAMTERPDVMLLDISMPGSDGYTLARTIRSQGWGANKRLIAVSGWLSEEDRARIIASGFNAHLSKPIDMDLLESLLSAAK